MLSSLVASLLLVLSGCTTGSDAERAPGKEARSGAQGRPGRGAKADRAGGARAEATAPASDDPDVVLVILDTVRADHTSLCGYGRPTTPFLQSLVAERGATYTCEGVAPGSWTLPSHATYFTGVLLPEHHFDSMKVPDWSGRQTLADQMAARGYETVLVTANPVLTKARGLAQGFHHVLSAAEIWEWRKHDVARHVEVALRKADRGKPLFLVVNVMDAHDPYVAIPDGLGWVPPRPKLDFQVKDRDADHPYHQFLEGKLAPEARQAFLDAVVDGYDHGISSADAALKETLGVLARQGRVERGMRLVVTSDHGEFLGEHGLLRHGGWVWEPVVRVPLLVVDTRPGHAPPAIPPGPFSTATVFDLVRDGALPATPREAVAFESASNFAENPGSNTVAWWAPGASHHKVVWTLTTDAEARLREDTVRYDLAADPGEAAPAAATEAEQQAIAPHVAGYKAHVGWRETQKADAADLAALQALGYVEKAAE